jgi:hypothetical protein
MRGIPVAALLLVGCASFVPLREPPTLLRESPPGNAVTREEVVARYGPPQDVRATDEGDVLVYRRRVVIEANPAHYYGEYRGDRLDRFERIMIYLDGEGRIVRWSSEFE